MPEPGLGRVTDLRASERQGPGSKLLSAEGVFTPGHSLIVGPNGEAVDSGESGSSTVERVPAEWIFGAPAVLNAFNPAPASLIVLYENFASTAPFTRYSESTPGTFSVASNVATVAHVGAQNDIITETASAFAMPQAFVSITVTQNGTAVSGGYDNVGVGIFKDQNNYLCATRNRRDNAVFIVLKIGGTAHFLGAVTGAAYAAPYKLGMSLVGNSAYVWVDTGSGWTHVTGASTAAYYNFRASGNLTGWKAGFTVASDATSTWKVADLKAGSFGTVGTRDITIVTHEDGTPYMQGDVVTLTATCSDPSGFTANGGSYCGVFTLNLATNALTQVGVIMVERDGGIWNDHGAHIIYYGNGDRRLTIATWGNYFGGVMKMMHKLTAADLLVGANVVSAMTDLALPGLSGGKSAYEGMLAYDAANSRWLLAYAITANTSFSGAFYPAAAYSPDLITWSLIAADTSVSSHEGTKLIVAAGAFWITAGGPAGTGTSPRVYDANMVYVGGLNATFANQPDTQPHAMIFGNGTTEYLLTFDNTRYGSASFTWGRFWVETAERYKPSIPTVVHVFTATVVSDDSTFYLPPHPTGGTITNWSLIGPGAASVKCWRKGAGAGLPSAGDSINTAALSVTAGGIINRSTTLTDFTSLVIAQGDVVAVHLESGDAATLQVEMS
jgi:hypothetical protein